MIVDEMRLSEAEDRVERSARVRWDGGDHRVWVATPAEFASRAEDASPFLCLTLLLAMRVGEDLELRGEVSPHLLGRVPRIVDVYTGWDPTLHRTRVHAARGLPAPGPRAAGIGCFLSRGVDSMYAASAPRGLPGPITHLVHCDRLEPLHSPAVRAEEVRLAGEVAALLELPLVVIETNLRELTGPLIRDWADMAGAGLAFLATSMAGGLGQMVIPSSAGQTTVIATGTSPMLDPLFSTEDVAIFHDVPAMRPVKVAWLARERPDLLPYLKVCSNADRSDNCGVCSKCLLTMLALEGSGALRAARAFPPAIDPEAMEAIRVRYIQPREEFLDVERTLRERGAAELADLVAGALDRGVTRPLDTPFRPDSPAFLDRTERRTGLAELAAGSPRPAPRRAEPGDRGAPRVSVLMPAHGADARLREAVASALGQTAGDLELIVVDDGSETPVAEFLSDVADERLRVIAHGRRRGPSAARNTALAAARAPLVAQLDPDDAWEQDYLEAVLPAFDDPGVGLVYANCTIVGHPAGHEEYIPDPWLHPIDSFPKLAEHNAIPSPTVAMRTHAVRAAGGYAAWLRQNEEHQLYMKLAHAGWRFAYVDRRLARHRWPEAGRGRGHRARRHELWGHAMFASFAARHPRTPGPRRQVRVRVRRELELARDVAARRMPEPAAEGRPRILVEPGSHAMLNLGDVAMLQVCVERLRALWPGASIGVVTGAPELLARHCPGTEPVPAAGQYEWFGAPWDGGAYLSAAGDRGRSAMERVARAVSAVGPRGARLALTAELAAREPAGDELRAFAGWMLAADAVVMSGRGGTTDAFLDDALEALCLLRIAAQLGCPTAMFSQGVGPIEGERLRREAGAALRLVDRIAVRDRLGSIPLLERLGVDPARVTLTGDDALEAAHRLRPAEPALDTIGVGVRVSEYSKLRSGHMEVMGAVLAELAAERGAALQPVTVSLYQHEADATALRHMTGVDGDAPESPADSIEQAGRCRVVVAGSYHSAVFALGQGVPVVALSATPYYDHKLEGLADLFPGGCTVLPAGERELPERLAAAVRDAWDAAYELRPALLASAEGQIAEARDAYERFAAEAGRRTGLQPAGTLSVTEESTSSESESLYL